MDTSDPSPKPLSAWKRLALVRFFVGVGFAVVAGLILGGVIWYSSRPIPEKPWNTTTIISKKQPTFDLSDDSTKIVLRYTLENAGDRDYRLDSSSAIGLMARWQDGTLSHPMSDPKELIRLPVFIPAKQKASLQISFPFAGVFARKGSESDAAFHDRLRNYLEQSYRDLGGFVIFDSNYRYQIDLPKWSDGRLSNDGYGLRRVIARWHQ